MDKKYEALTNELIHEWRNVGIDPRRLADVISSAVERCYALANKPVRALTSAEITEEYQKTYPADKPTRADFTVIRAILAAHQRKQQEPETVTFRAARHKADNRVSMLQVIDDANIASCWEWLPGEPQTIEVKLP